MKQAIHIKGLKKTHDLNFTLGPIDLEIPSGTIVGLIGENGAGKTTLIKSILNGIKVDQGSIEIFGEDYQKQEQKIKEEIGVVLDQAFFPELLTPKDIHTIMKESYQNWDKTFYERCLKEFGLPIHQPIKTLSKGMRKKLEIATALSHHPKLLILDEPTSGLDPIVRKEVLALFLDFVKDEEHTILLSTHITSELERIADQIVLLHQGKIVLDETREIMLENHRIIRCDKKYFENIPKEDIIRYQRNQYSYDVLVKNKRNWEKKQEDVVVDKVTLEELMVFMIKGEK